LARSGAFRFATHSILVFRVAYRTVNLAGRSVVVASGR
jgi:hypothetical protein